MVFVVEKMSASLSVRLSICWSRLGPLEMRVLLRRRETSRNNMDVLFHHLPHIHLPRAGLCVSEHAVEKL